MFDLSITNTIVDFLDFILKVNCLGFRSFACNLHSVGLGTIQLGMHVNVDEVTSVLKFEWT